MLALLATSTALTSTTALRPVVLTSRSTRTATPTSFFDLNWQPPWQTAASTADLEAALLLGGSDARETIRIFEALESAAAPPADLLTSRQAVAIDGRWRLEKTIAAQVGSEDLETAGVSDAINASGIIVDTSSKPIQEVSVDAQRIGNEIEFSLPLVGTVFLRVAGSFAASESNGRRAMVEFDSLEIFSGDGRRLLTAGFLFDLIRRLRPSLTNGDDGASWLETTYISPRVRLGRGNKGSIFVLTRATGDAPLKDWPL